MKKAIKSLSVLLAAALLSFMVSACTMEWRPIGTSDYSDSSEMPAESATSNSSFPGSASSISSGMNAMDSPLLSDNPVSSSEGQVNASNLSIDPSQEPPLYRWYPEDVNTPDFLNQEQKDIYCRAARLASALFLDSSSIDRFPLLPEQEVLQPTDPIQIEGSNFVYRYSIGRYREADDFFAVINSIFTSEGFDKINSPNGADERFSSKDGLLIYLDGSRGSNQSRTQEPDRFELISSDEESVMFMVIANYENQDGSLSEQKFPIHMVFIDNGWLSEYNITY